MSEIKVILEWKKFDKLEDVLKEKDEEAYGVYQITGYHAVFGDASLLYIGRAVDQSFAERFRQHENWLRKESGIKIYLGRVDSIDDNDGYAEEEWKRITKDVEILLIYYHSPPYNSTFISESPKPTSKLRIINIGDYGDLYPEISHEGLELEEKGLQSRPLDEP
jgi:hypothetical protein